MMCYDQVNKRYSFPEYNEEEITTLEEMKLFVLFWNGSFEEYGNVPSYKRFGTMEEAEKYYIDNEEIGNTEIMKLDLDLDREEHEDKLIMENQALKDEILDLNVKIVELLGIIRK